MILSKQRIQMSANLKLDKNLIYLKSKQRYSFIETAIAIIASLLIAILYKLKSY